MRALVYPDDAEAGALPAGVEAVAGDFERPETLAPAMHGVTSVFLVAPGSPRLVAQEANVISAAAQAGVGRVVKVSAIGAADDSAFSITRWHAESERLLKSSGMAWTILQPNFFMQNVLVMFPTILSEATIYAPAGDGRISMVDAGDVGAVAAAVLTGGGHEETTYVVTGPEPLSLAEVATRVSPAAGREVGYVDLPPEQARRAMMAHGTREPFADALLGLFQFVKDGHAAVVTDAVATIARRPPRTLDQYLVEFGHEFQVAGGG